MRPPKLIRHNFRRLTKSILLRGVHRTRPPAQPAGPARTQTATTRTDQFDGWRRVATHRTRSLRVGQRVSSPKPEPPDPTIKSTKSGEIERFSDKELLEIHQIRRYFLFSDEDLLEIHQIRRDPVRSTPDLTDPAKYWPDLDRSGEISAPAAKYRNWRRNPKPNRHQPETRRTRTG